MQKVAFISSSKHTWTLSSLNLYVHKLSILISLSLEIHSNLNFKTSTCTLSSQVVLVMNFPTVLTKFWKNEHDFFFINSPKTKDVPTASDCDIEPSLKIHRKYFPLCTLFTLLSTFNNCCADCCCTLSYNYINPISWSFSLPWHGSVIIVTTSRHFYPSRHLLHNLTVSHPNSDLTVVPRVCAMQR